MIRFFRWVLQRVSRRSFLRASSSWREYAEYVKVHPTAIIDPSASVRILNPPVPPEICLEIGEGSHVFSHFSLLRPSAKIRVGRRCQLGQSHFICADSIEVGDDVIMAWGVTIIDSDNHSLYWSERQYDVERCRKDYIETGGRDLARTHDWSKAKIAKVRIGDKSWIGFNVIILKGVTVGEGAIVGAGSVLTSDVKPWHLGAGNPLTHKRQLSRSRDEANVG